MRVIRENGGEEDEVFMDRSVAIASDHAGFEQKRQLVEWMLRKGIDVHDLGPYNDERVDYPDFAVLVAREVSKGMARMGVLVCGTGIGMAMTANKFSGIRAANVTAPHFAELAREHNDANIITLSGRFVGLETNKGILEAFLSTPFGQGRHAERVQKITAIERDQKDQKADQKADNDRR